MTAHGPEWDFDSTVPQISRVHQALIHLKDCYAADRAMAAELLTACPSLGETALAGREFMARAVDMAAEAGIDQFLDIGAGLPQGPFLHKHAQRINPRARIVYVDPDPLVATHGRAMMAGPHIGWVEGNLTDPDSILQDPDGYLDLRRPVAVTLIHVTDYVPDALAAVRKIMDILPSGSMLAICQYTAAFNSGAIEDVAALHDRHQIPFAPRNREEIAAFFDGLDLVEPGIVPPNEWHTDLHRTNGILIHSYAAVGRKVS